jgi:FkbM family methyltransferase
MAQRKAQPGRAAADRLVLVDVGGAGGLQEAWLPHAGRIAPVLFEPNPEEARKLRERLGQHYGEALVLETGLSNRTGEQALNIAAYWGCSSMRQPEWETLSRYRIAPAFKVERQVGIACTRYDRLHAEGRVPAPDAIKVDVQGYEYEVLQGFGGLLQTCLGIEIETHVYPLYKGQRLLHDMVALLADFGFVLRNLKPVGSFDGDLVEMDAWFTKDIRHWRGLDAAGRAKFGLLCEAWGLIDYSRVNPGAPHWEIAPPG